MFVVKTLITAISATIAAILSALTVPALLITASVVVDNPWSVVANHAKRAGKLLARSLIDRAAGNRPVSLVGWSHGARVIFSALEYLAKVSQKFP